MIACAGLGRESEGGSVHDVTLNVEAGQALGLVGSSEAGKSAILRMLAGQLRPGSGTARVFGMDCWPRRREIFKRTVYAPAVPALEMDMTGEQYLRFAGRYFGGLNPQKAHGLSEKLGLTLTGQCRQLGAEDRKKLSLLAALSLDKDVFLLDEPFSGLSNPAKGLVTDALAGLRENGAAVLLTTHVLEDARRSCSHVAIVRQGRIVVSQPVEALSLTRQKVYHITFSTPREAASFAGEWESGVELIGSRALVAIPASPKVLIQTLSHYEVLDFIGGREEAEEGFLRYYGDDIV